MTKYQHDCEKCHYLGTGKCPALGEDEFDFYICTGPTGRSMIARYGSEGPEYTSGVLFGCEELTDLDKVALFAGLELLPEEEKRLLGVLARMWRQTIDYLGVNTYGNHYLNFGYGNVVWRRGGI